MRVLIGVAADEIAGHAIGRRSIVALRVAAKPPP
jgi:hypothetical protein